MFLKSPPCSTEIKFGTQNHRVVGQKLWSGVAVRPLWPSVRAWVSGTSIIIFIIICIIWLTSRHSLWWTRTNQLDGIHNSLSTRFHVRETGSPPMGILPWGGPGTCPTRHVPVPWPIMACVRTHTACISGSVDGWEPFVTFSCPFTFCLSLLRTHFTCEHSQTCTPTLRGGWQSVECFNMKTHPKKPRGYTSFVVVWFGLPLLWEILSLSVRSFLWSPPPHDSNYGS